MRALALQRYKSRSLVLSTSAGTWKRRNGSLRSLVDTLPFSKRLTGLQVEAPARHRVHCATAVVQVRTARMQRNVRRRNKSVLSATSWDISLLCVGQAPSKTSLGPTAELKNRRRARMVPPFCTSAPTTCKTRVSTSMSTVCGQHESAVSRRYRLVCLASK